MNYWNERLCEWTQFQPRTLALVDAQNRLTWSDVDANSQAIRSALLQAGVLPHSRIILAMTRSSASALALVACLRTPFCGLTIERNSLRERLELSIQSLEPSAIIFTEQDSLFINEILSKRTLPTAQQIDRWNDRWNELILPAGLRALVRRAATEAKSTQQAGWLLQTSGSTKFPLTAGLSASDLIQRSLGEVRDFQLEPATAALNILSFAHDLGFNQLLSWLSSGLSLTIHTDPFSSQLVERLQASQAIGLVATPAVWTELFKLNPPMFEQSGFLTVSGGALKPAAFQRLAALFPASRILRTYGQTETFRSLLNSDIADDSWGLPLSGVNLQVIGPKGTECAPGQMGELVHYGSGCMLGYIGDDVASRNKFHNGGIRTGDLFYREESGRFFFGGRMDDMIKRWDQRLHLSEIESAVASVPDIAHAIAVSKPAADGDPRQNLVCLFASPCTGRLLEKELLLTHCKSVLAPYKVPDQILIVPEMQYTISSKVDRRTLLKRWSEEPL